MLSSLDVFPVHVVSSCSRWLNTKLRSEGHDVNCQVGFFPSIIISTCHDFHLCEHFFPSIQIVLHEHLINRLSLISKFREALW
mgnify:FL=1